MLGLSLSLLLLLPLSGTSAMTAAQTERSLLMSKGPRRAAPSPWLLRPSLLFVISGLPDTRGLWCTSSLGGRLYQLAHRSKLLLYLPSPPQLPSQGSGDGRAAQTSALEAERWRFPKDDAVVEKERGDARCAFSSFLLPVSRGIQTSCCTPSGLRRFQTVVLFPVLFLVPDISP